MFVFPNIAKNISRRFASQGGCLALLQEGKTLNWKVFDNSGSTTNLGTLVITYAKAETGDWKGQQISENNNNTVKVVVGTFDESSMVMENPGFGGEKWHGLCNDGKIEGSIKGYLDPYSFEMYE